MHRGILEARLEKRAILPNFNVDIRDPKFLIGLRLTESNLRFRNFGFEMGFCPISQFPLLVTQVCCCPRRGGEYSAPFITLPPLILQHDHFIIRRVSIQPLHNRGTPFEHCALVDVTLVGDLTGIDGGWLG